MTKYLLSAFIFLIFHSTAYAQGLYLGANYEKVEFEGKYYGSNFTKFDVVSVLVGYQINQYFAIESTVGTAVSNGKDVPYSSISGGGSLFSESDLDYIAGLYINGKYQLTPRLSVFGKIGYAVTAGDVDEPYEDSDALNQDGISYGGGLNVSVSEHSSFRFSYSEIDFSGSSRNVQSTS